MGRLLLSTLLLLVSLRLVAQPQSLTMTVDLTQPGNPLKKPGLGSLFGISNLAGGPSKSIISGALLTIASSQSRPGQSAGAVDSPDAPNQNPFGTDVVAPLIRGTDVRMICRFNDMIPGFPYTWTTLADWLTLVEGATRRVSSMYKDVTLCIAPLNEPDNKLQGRFMTDPDVPGNTYDEKVNYVWTQTVRRIRAIDATIPLMGPNYETYRPWERSGADQVRMRSFLQNAIATNTVPDLIGWHNLVPSPGDIPEALSKYYRPLETELNVPGRPLKMVVEEFGRASGDFEGVPGTMIKYFADLERYGVDYGAMGIYTNGALLGNTVRYVYDADLKPNAGYQLLNWYKQMAGVSVPVSRWDTRRYQAFDGVASYEAATKTATVLLGGSDDNAVVVLKGAEPLWGKMVRVRTEAAVWLPIPNEINAKVDGAGDPVSAPLPIFDKTFTTDASGNLTIPLTWIDQYSAYRLQLSPPESGTASADKYEAETAVVNQGVVKANVLPASGGSIVSGLANSDSYVEWKTVSVPKPGIYEMTIRYASPGSGGATQRLTINGLPQGNVTYGFTNGTAEQELRYIVKLVALNQGSNTIRLTRESGSADLDFIHLRPQQHHYEAEFANYATARTGRYAANYYEPTYVGGLDNTNSFVEFTVTAPKKNRYDLTVAYANATSQTAVHDLTINGTSKGKVSFIPTGGWLDNANLNTVRKTQTLPVYLNEGLNRIRFTKAENYAELDYLTLTYTGNATDTTDAIVLATEPLPPGWRLYPNPATDRLTIQSDYPLDRATFSLLTPTGQRRSLSATVSGQTAQISVSQFPMGLYLLEAALTDGPSVHLKILINN